MGYTGSTDNVLTLRPGTYWLTVNDTSTKHNFALESPTAATRHSPTSPRSADDHRAAGMYVTIEVGGDGQAG